ncbi:MAG: ATP-binding cassette domain-containing protein [Clostridia bacterium]|nr:ATP-binding cassette domain-containing protein [Clostridia bacterium]
MNPDILLSVRDVSMNYGTGRQDAIEHVSVDIKKGEILALVGSNGSGKSTLLKGMLRLMPFACGEMEKRRGLKIGYLAQMHTAAKNFPASVREVVLSGTRQERFSPFYTKRQRQLAAQAMELLDVTALADTYIGDLSGGQMQRVLLARCVAGENELLLLDEPCSALDPAITHELYHVFMRLRDEKGVSIVIATHDWNFVREHADRVLVLDRSVEYLGDISDWHGREDEHTCHH